MPPPSDLKTPLEAAVPLPAPKRKRHPYRWGGAAVFLALFGFISYIGVIGGNVRIVDEGRVYRSAQLTGNGYDGVSARLVGNSLDNVLHRYGVHTVVSLRGGSEKDRYYREEEAVCAQDNVDHVNVPFSAQHLPSPETVTKLIDTFDHARYPIILHCQAGSDRTGLASALYIHLYRHLPITEAQNKELTWRYGHFPIQKTRRMDTFFDLYRSTGNGQDLRTWIARTYPSVYAASPDK